jgi:hypothetical protein
MKPGRIPCTRCRRDCRNDAHLYRLWNDAILCRYCGPEVLHPPDLNRYERTPAEVQAQEKPVQGGG